MTSIWDSSKALSNVFHDRAMSLVLNHSTVMNQSNNNDVSKKESRIFILFESQNKGLILLLLYPDQLVPWTWRSFVQDKIALVTCLLFVIGGFLWVESQLVPVFISNMMRNIINVLGGVIHTPRARQYVTLILYVFCLFITIIIIFLD